MEATAPVVPDVTSNNLTVEVQNTGIFFGSVCPMLSGPAEPLMNDGCDIAEVELVSQSWNANNKWNMTYSIKFHADVGTEPSMQVLLIFSHQIYADKVTITPDVSAFCFTKSHLTSWLINNLRTIYTGPEWEKPYHD